MIRSHRKRPRNLLETGRKLKNTPSVGHFPPESGVDVWNDIFSLGRAINRGIAPRRTDDGDGEGTNGSVGGSAATAATTTVMKF